MSKTSLRPMAKVLRLLKRNIFWSDRDFEYFLIFLGKPSKSTVTVKKCSSEIHILSKVKHFGYEASKL